MGDRTYIWSKTFKFLIVVFVLFLALSPDFVRKASAQSDGGANAMFVEAVMAYRQAVQVGGSQRVEAFAKVREIFDRILIQHHKSRPADAIRAGGAPGGVELTLLPPSQPPDGWNDGKRAIVRDLLADYDSDIDRIHQVAEAARYALLAGAAYGEPDQLAAAEAAGFKALPRLGKDRRLVGDATAILFTHSNGEVVLAFRGTSQKKDWITNVGGTVSWTPILNWQVSDALMIAEDVYKEHPKVVFVGHSLGGRLAQVASMKTGQPAFVFNSAPVGANELRQMGFSGLLDGKVQRFRTPQDPLSRIFPLRDTEVSNIAAVNFNIMDNLRDSVQFAHAAGFLASAMENVRLARDTGWIAAYQREQKKQLDNQVIQARGTHEQVGKTQPITLDTLAGKWVQSGDGWEWTYIFDGGVATVASGGDETRPINRDILRVKEMSGSVFQGSWRSRDGKWVNISGEILNDTIKITARTASGNVDWIWRRAPSVTVSDTSDSASFSGKWFQAINGTRRAYLFEGRTAKSVEYGDRNRPVGSTILRIFSIDGKKFTGQWLYANGRWYDVEGRLAGERIVMRTFNHPNDTNEWILTRKPPAEVVPKLLFDYPLYERKKLSVSGKKCSIYAPWTEPTAVEWSGICKDSLPVGDGRIVWFKNDKAIWVSNVGVEHGLIFRSGKLHISKDLSDASININCKKKSGALDRYAQVRMPQKTKESIFHNNWLAANLVERAVEAVVEACPQAKTLSGKAVRYGGEIVEVFILPYTSHRGIKVSGRTQTGSERKFRQYNNFTLKAVEKEVSQVNRSILEEKRRVKQQRQLEAAEQRRQAEEQRKEKARRIQEERAAAIRIQFEAGRENIIGQAKSFINLGAGSLDDLAAGLEWDEVATLERLENGVSLELGPADGVQTVDLEGKRGYRTGYSVRSPFARYEAEFRSRQNFSWENWFAQVQSSPARRTDVSCTFKRLGALPKQRKTIKGSLLSFSSNSQVVSISLLCR